MAATFAFLPRKRRDKPSSTAPTAPTKRWEVHFSRFFGYPPSLSSACPDLVPLPTRFRNRRPGAGHWVSSSSPALLQLVPDLSTADLFLSVCFGGKILEEHRVSKLQFVWPRVSCNSEVPARGTRAVFAIYRNCMGQVEKFALRFLSAKEAEKFMNSLKEIFDIGSGMCPRNTDLGSEISSQSEFMSSNGPHNQVSMDLNIMLPAQTYTTQISPSLMNEAEQYSCTREMTLTNNFHGNFPAVPPGFTVFRRDDQPVVQQVSGLKDIVAPQLAVPGPIHLQSQVMAPSFTSWLGSCHPLFEQVAAQSTAAQEVNLKSQFTRHVGDASFQDMLIKMETFISEMGGDLTL